MDRIEIERKVSQSGTRYLITLPKSLNLEWQKMKGKKVKITIEMIEAGGQAEAQSKS